MQNEKIIETKTCRLCSAKFDITDKDLEFYEKVSPVFPSSPALLHSIEKGVVDLGDGRVKYLIPTPTLCPDCRQQRRLSFRNERNLYKRKCDATGKSIISMYSPDKPYKVYEQSEWWSDKWDALDYGKEFDFNKSFFEQFDELSKIIPYPSRESNMNENSDYTNMVGFLKNCYLCFDSGYDENCYYSNGVFKSNNLVDCSSILQGEDCYECIDCNNCYNVQFAIKCQNCSDSYKIFDCIGGSNNFLSVGLRNKNYHFLNKNYSKEEYIKITNKFFTDKNFNKESLNQFNNLSQGHPVKFAYINNSNYSSGDYLNNSENITNGFQITDGNKSKYVYQAYNISDCYDIISFGDNSNLIYEGMGVGTKAHFIDFSYYCYDNISNIFYSTYCLHGSSNLFGCIGLRNKSYCIFNKQYTKEEYKTLVPKIIEHMKKTREWGEFFPSSISPFGYNETVASEYFPLDRRDVLQYVSTGAIKWSDYENPKPDVAKIIPASKLPENIKEIPDDILNWAIECEVTGKSFRIIKQELDFYRKHNLPIPRRHPDQRHLDRMKLRNPRKLFDRKCDKCKKDIKTTYSPDRKEIVYCEECYNKEVF